MTRRRVFAQEECVFDVDAGMFEVWSDDCRVAVHPDPGKR